MIKRRFCVLGPVAAACILTPLQVFGQSTLSLQPMQTLAQGPTLGFSPLSPPPPLNSSRPITLENIQRIDNPSASPTVQGNQTLSVLPLTPASQGPKNAMKGSLNVDDMIRRPIQSTDAFSRLNIVKDFGLGAQMAPEIRSQYSGADNFFDWSPSGYCWQSPSFCYSPLYFEQPNLERYGNSKGPLLAPAWSATYFFGQVAAWPATALYQLPWTKSCTLGNHRPGDCAPFQKRPYYNSLGHTPIGSNYQVASPYVPPDQIIQEQVTASQAIGSGSLQPSAPMNPAVHISKVNNPPSQAASASAPIVRHISLQ